MKQGRTDRDWAVVALMTFVAGAVIAWALTSNQQAWPKLTVEQSAAWVQAIGSIVAILLAVAVPAVQHAIAAKIRQREARDKSRSLGLLLLPHIRALTEKNNQLWSMEHPDDDVYDVDDRTCQAGEYAVAALTIPAEILKHVAVLHDLGEAAAGLQRAIFNIGAAGEISFVPPHEDYLLVTDKTRFYDLLWDALVGLTESQERIEALFPHSIRPVAVRSHR